MHTGLDWEHAQNLLLTGVARKVMYETPNFDDVFFAVKDGEIWCFATDPNRRPPQKRKPLLGFELKAVE